jgi:hypothetical protein
VSRSPSRNRRTGLRWSWDPVPGRRRRERAHHFPELADLIRACSRHATTLNPPPDLRPAGGDPLQDLEQTLAALYAWYRSNQGMQRNVHHHRHLVPELDELLASQSDAALEAAAAAHANRAAARVTAARALIRVALKFRTWEVLDRLGLPDAEMARLFRRAVEGTSAGT